MGKNVSKNLGAGAGRERGIHRVNVERQVQRALRAEVRERELHHLADAVLVDLLHREGLDAQRAQTQLLARVEVAQTFMI